MFPLRHREAVQQPYCDDTRSACLCSSSPNLRWRRSLLRTWAEAVSEAFSHRLCVRDQGLLDPTVASPSASLLDMPHQGKQQSFPRSTLCGREAQARHPCSPGHRTTLSWRPSQLEPLTMVRWVMRPVMPACDDLGPLALMVRGGTRALLVRKRGLVL